MRKPNRVETYHNEEGDKDSMKTVGAHQEDEVLPSDRSEDDDGVENVYIKMNNLMIVMSIMSGRIRRKWGRQDGKTRIILFGI